MGLPTVGVATVGQPKGDDGVLSALEIKALRSQAEFPHLFGTVIRCFPFALNAEQAMISALARP